MPKRNQHLIRTTIPTSHGFRPRVRPGQPEISNPLPTSNKSEFVQLFEFVATQDMSQYFCVTAALEFRRRACGGEEKIMQYCHDVVAEGIKRAANILGTEVLDNEDRTLTNCAMMQVRLPLKVSDGEDLRKHPTTVKLWLMRRLAEDYDMFIPVFFHANVFWARFSGQIYLEVDDYERGAKALAEVCQKAADGAYLEDA